VGQALGLPLSASLAGRRIACPTFCYSGIDGLLPSMAQDYRFRSTGYSASYYLPTGVKWLLISNIAIFIAYFFTSHTLEFWDLLKLRSGDVLIHGGIWK